MLRWAVVLGGVVAGVATACPTCVGPRLGDEDRPLAFSSTTIFGIDWLDHGIQRDELREELGVSAVLRERLALEGAVPLVWRWLTYAESQGTAWGAGDARAQLRFDAWRDELPAVSNTLSLLGGVQSSLMPLSTAPYEAQLGSNAFTPRAGLQFRHADQRWGIAAQLLGGWPIAYSTELNSGRWAQLSTAAAYEATSSIRVQAIVTLKAQERAIWQGAPVAASGFFAGFAGGSVSVRPTKRLSISAAVLTPIFCISDGYAHSPVFQISLEVT